MAKGFIPGGIGEAMHILRGKLATSITRYPTGRYGIVGSIPYALTVEYTSGFSHGRKSMTWESEGEVIKALLAEGVTHFQLNDCSWYEAGQ